jgi:hypothetical protein
VTVTLFDRRQFENSANVKQEVQSPVCLGSPVTQVHKVKLYPKHFYIIGEREDYILVVCPGFGHSYF